MPPSASPDASRIVVGRAIRGFVDGFVSVLLARYLTGIGFSPVQVGAVVTGTLLGSAALTLVFGLSSHRYPMRTLLLVATVMMVATGIGFTTIAWFPLLLIVAVAGTLNPSGGDVSVFLPTEQALVAGHVNPTDRPRLYAVYNVAGTFAGALGALASIAPEHLASRFDTDVITAQRGGFVLYALAGLLIYLIYRGLRRYPDPHVVGDDESAREGLLPRPTSARDALTSSRRIVIELAALFSLDSAGSGFVGTTLLVLWLFKRFDLSATTTGGVFFAAGLLGACSQFLAPRLARHIGLIRTMVFTHIPANALLALAAFVPPDRGGIAIALLLVRSLFAQMDVPARQAFVMAVVPPEERAAASSVTNVPRSLASATTPLLAGLLLTHSTFGWPLLVAGTLKITYDLLLLALYRDVPEEVGAVRSRSV